MINPNDMEAYLAAAKIVKAGDTFSVIGELAVAHMHRDLLIDELDRLRAVVRSCVATLDHLSSQPEGTIRMSVQAVANRLGEAAAGRTDA